jgi:ADP-ribosylglycohydrolase
LASSGLTHRGWQAEIAALAVAESTALTVRTQKHPETEDVLKMLRAISNEAEWQSILSRIESSLISKHSVSEFARHLGLEKGVTGYALHVVPVALYAWLRHSVDFRSGMIEVLEAGGDTDTTGAIFGALAGGSVGERGIPQDWLDSVSEWPRSHSFMRQIASRLADQHSSMSPLGPLRYFWPGLLLRNVFFLIVVLLHGLRRLAPPY